MITRLEIDPKIIVRDGSDLVQLPEAIRVAHFSPVSVKNFATSMSAAQDSGQPVIPIVIDSYGGEVYSLFAMVDIIKSCRVPVATVVLGKAASCASALFTCGAEGYRFMGPNATLMIHDVSDASHRKKSEEFLVDAKETDRLNKKFYSLIDKNCGLEAGHTWGLVQGRGRTDWYLSPKQAVRHGYANHVGVPKLVTRVTVSTTLEW